jgi:Helix-turn-helix.
LLSKRLSLLRKEKKKTQQEMADYLGITRPAYTAYETGNRHPDYDTLQKIADYFDVSVDYLLGRTDIKSTKVAGKEVELSPEEYKLFEELKKHPILFHDLASDPEGKVKELLKLYKMKKILLEEDNEEYGEGFGELED